MSDFLLVHPPLLGPAVWQPCAEVLRARGHTVHVPDLRAAVGDPDGWWDRYAAGCRPYLADHPGTIVAGHSGAGVALPLVVAGQQVRAVVFVDALVPDLADATMPSERIRAFTRGLAHDGVLPVWSDWWPATELRALVPDNRLRANLIAELPTVPAAFYDHAVPVPTGWDEGLAVHYLQLSAAYAEAATSAAARGWPVVTWPGGHLDLLTRPTDVAEVLIAAA